MADRYLLSGGKALDALLPPPAPTAAFSLHDAPLTEHVNDFERQLITDSVRRHKGDMRAVMREMGLPRRTLNEKMTKLGISRAAIMERYGISGV